MNEIEREIRKEGNEWINKEINEVNERRGRKKLMNKWDERKK